MPRGRPAKRRRLTPPLDDSVTSETIKSADLLQRAATWDLEQDYEQRSRHKKTKEATRLPTKTLEGTLQKASEQGVAEDESGSFLGSASDEEELTWPETPPTDIETKPKVPLKEQLIEAKEEIARIASLLNEDPEEHAGLFKKLGLVSGPKSHSVVQKVALAAQAAIYKDVIPGYRIRAYKDEDLGNKVSKDVRTTRQYEQALVMGYQSYVKRLGSLARGKGKAANQSSLKTVAINCACTLLLAAPHFNFRTELLNILIHEVSTRDAKEDFFKCIETLEAFFAMDDDGAPSLEAVSLLTKMMRAKDYRIREEVLNTFFELRLLSELSAKSSTTRADKPEDMSKLLGRRVKKEKQEHRSKKDRKLAKERRAVEKDMREADASVNYEEREKLQSDTLKMVFVTYFRILKERVPWLMGAVLEGLAKYAHLINQDFFGDILEALKDIIAQAEAVSQGEDDADAPEEDDDVRNRTRESLLSTQTAFTLLSGQDISKAASALRLDLSFFSNHIYRSLYTLALDSDIELGPKSLHLADPHAPKESPQQSKINISTPILLLTRVLTSIILTPSQPPPTATAASFYKRLLTTSLQLPEKSTLALLGLLSKVADKHGRKLEPLWYSDERKGDGVYRGESDSVEGTNVMAVGSGVWEGELLRQHYCPKVREQIKLIDKVIAGLARQH